MGAGWPLPRSSAGLRAIADKMPRLQSAGRPGGSLPVPECHSGGPVLKPPPMSALRHVPMRQCDKHANLGLGLPAGERQRAPNPGRAGLRGTPQRSEAGIARITDYSESLAYPKARRSYSAPQVE